jgi:hypothetical protein
MKTNCLSLLLCTVAAGLPGASLRTDINPAMQYYQAYILAPDLPQADRDFLFVTEWRGQKLPERFGELVARYDNQFKLVRQAAQATVACDWGVDMTPGPFTLLPHLARNKAIAQASRCRVMWDLQQGRPGEARDDLLAAFALARNTSRDGTLIAALVQIAMEDILCSIVAENYHRFSPEQLQQLAEGFDAAPARGTMAACISAEKAFFYQWLLAKVQELQRANPDHDAKVMAGIQELIGLMRGSGDSFDPEDLTNHWSQVTKVCGGTSAGVLRLLREMEPLYQKLGAIMALPLPEYESPMREFNAEIKAIMQKGSNPFVSEFFPALENCRSKEFAVLAELAMLRAAVEFKLHGAAGMEKVKDPCGSGPFVWRRFEFRGEDRGFELKSAYNGRGFPIRLIFVESDGAPFSVSGKDAGRALPKPWIAK